MNLVEIRKLRMDFVEMETRKLRAGWSFEAAEDLKAIHGIGGGYVPPYIGLLRDLVGNLCEIYSGIFGSLTTLRLLSAQPSVAQYLEIQVEAGSPNIIRLTYNMLDRSVACAVVHIAEIDICNPESDAVTMIDYIIDFMNDSSVDKFRELVAKLEGKIEWER